MHLHTRMLLALALSRARAPAYNAYRTLRDGTERVVHLDAGVTSRRGTRYSSSSNTRRSTLTTCSYRSVRSVLCAVARIRRLLA